MHPLYLPSPAPDSKALKWGSRISPSHSKIWPLKSGRVQANWRLFRKCKCLWLTIFISDGAVNALYHASKQYYHNAIAYKCKDLKIRRVWHCLILTLSYLKTKFLQHTSPGSKETYIGLVGARSQPGLVTTDHRLFYTWMLFTQASLLGRCFCQSALVLHYTTKYHHRTMQLYNCTLYHEISSQNYATIQLYNILRQFTHSYFGYFLLLSSFCNYLQRPM